MERARRADGTLISKPVVWSLRDGRMHPGGLAKSWGLALPARPALELPGDDEIPAAGEGRAGDTPARLGPPGPRHRATLLSC